MSEFSLVSEYMHAAVGGVSKRQLDRTFKIRYSLLQEEIDQIEKLCSLKSKPKHIDYSYFYNLPVTRCASRIFYPFTQIYVYDDFLSAEECRKLVNIIDQNVRPSTVSDPNDECTVSNYRTSQTADLNYFSDPFYLSIDQKITALMGLDPFLGETAQAQRYKPGEYYKEHWDFFMPATKEYNVYCDWMGQRTWTAMVYLNDVQEGGETYFKHLKLRVKPKQGKLVAWNNLYKNGLPNLKTMHEALPPRSENKYVITKWFRSWSLI